eukprot:TRINITY_DN4603_c0_g2_i3.p1 TRINITY_DN4603_c0_g2~~TRINITY_DN4603_c0_g2_i3.p1  ORF type:complete len:1836 (+),score=264.92 TRINITY_DN4603_c0_g2_i3:75-5582(+)
MASYASMIHGRCSSLTLGWTLWACLCALYGAVQMRNSLDFDEAPAQGSSKVGANVWRVAGDSWKPCPGKVTQTVWNVKKTWQPPRQKYDPKVKTADGMGHPLIFGGFGNHTLDAPELKPMETVDAARASDELEKSQANVKDLLESVARPLTPLDTSTEADVARLKAAMVSDGVMIGRQSNTMQQVHNQGLLRGRMLAVNSASEFSALDRVVDLTSAMRTLSQSDPSTFQMLVQHTSGMDAKEFVMESEDVAAAQQANKMISSFGASSLQEMDQSFAANAGASFMSASFKVGMSSGKSEMSSDTSDSRSESSDSTRTSTKTMSQSRYYLEPRMQLVLDRSMLTPDVGFLKESNSIALTLCKERGEQGCEQKWALDGTGVSSLPPSSSICANDMSEPKARSVEQDILARNLLARFGSHVCPQAVLGGWWKITANLNSASTMSSTAASEATARAIESASKSESGAEASAGLGDAFSVGVSSSESETDEEAESSDEASGSASTSEQSNFNMQINQSWRGGSTGVSLKDWRDSLSTTRSSEWKVIDRNVDKCIGVWNFMADNYSACAVCEKWLELFLADLGLQKLSVSKQELKESCQSDGLMRGLISKAVGSQDLKQQAELEWKATRCSSQNVYKEYVLVPVEIEGSSDQPVGISSLSFAMGGSELAMSSGSNVPTYWYQRPGEDRSMSYKNVGKQICEAIDTKPSKGIDQCMRLCNADRACSFISSLPATCTLFSSCAESSASDAVDNILQKPEVLWLTLNTNLIISFPEETPIEFFRYFPTGDSENIIKRLQLYGGQGANTLLVDERLYAQGAGFGIAEVYTTYGVPWMVVHGAAGPGRYWDAELGQCSLNQCYCKHNGNLVEGTRGKACPSHGLVDCPECCSAGQLALCATMKCEQLGTHVNNPSHGDRPCSGSSCSTANVKDVAQCCMDKSVSSRYVLELTACDVILGGYWGPIDVWFAGESTRSKNYVLTPAHTERDVWIDRNGKKSFSVELGSEPVIPNKICFKKTSWNADSLCIKHVSMQNPNLPQGASVVGEARDLFDVRENAASCATIVRKRSVALSLADITVRDSSDDHQRHASHSLAELRHDVSSRQALSTRSSRASGCVLSVFESLDCSGSPVGIYEPFMANELQRFPVNSETAIKSFEYSDMCASVELQLVQKDGTVAKVGAGATKSNRCWLLEPDYASVQSVALLHEPCLCVLRLFSGSGCDSSEEMAAYSTSSAIDLTPLSNAQSCRYNDASRVSSRQAGQVGSLSASSSCSKLSMQGRSLNVGSCQNVNMRGITTISIAGTCEESEPKVAQNCSGKTPWPSVEWLASGFNIVNGDPFPDEGGLKGFGLNVFKVEYSAGTGTGDEGTCVPDGYDIKTAIASTFSVSSKVVRNSGQYADAVSDSFGLSGSLSASAQGMSGTLAGSYNSESSRRSEKAKKGAMKLIISSAYDNVYTALTKPGIGAPKPDPDFHYAVFSASSHEQYHAIFEDYGTDYATKMQMGARFYDKYYLDEESFFEMMDEKSAEGWSASLDADKELSDSATSAAIGEVAGDAAKAIADTVDFGDKDKAALGVSMSSADSFNDASANAQVNGASERVTTVVGGELARGPSGELEWVKNSKIPPLPIQFEVVSICGHQSFVLAGKVETCTSAREKYLAAKRALLPPPEECVWHSDCKWGEQCKNNKCEKEPVCEVELYDGDNERLIGFEYRLKDEATQGTGFEKLLKEEYLIKNVKFFMLSGACKKIKLYDDDTEAGCSGLSSSDHMERIQMEECLGREWKVSLGFDLRYDTCGFNVWVHDSEDIKTPATGLCPQAPPIFPRRRRSPTDNSYAGRANTIGSSGIAR